MTKIEQIKKMNIYEKLVAVQSELKVPKSQWNDFSKFNYRSCEDILEAVKPLLLKYGLALTISDELVLVGERYYVKATASLFNVASTNVVTNTAYAREDETKKGMDGSQITGSASSYARKRALDGLFAIDDTEDSDTTNTEEETKPSKTPREQLIDKLHEKGIDINAYAKENNLSAKTTDAEFKKLLAQLEG